MTATNPLWAEETGLQVPGTQKKGGNYFTRMNGAWAVSKIIRTSYFRSPFMILMPVWVGLFVAGLGVISMIVNRVTFNVVAPPLGNSGAASSLMGILLVGLMGVHVYRGATVIMGMGVHRSTYWNGLVLTVLITAIKLLGIITVLVAVELFTYGWGIFWGIFSSPTLIPALRDSYGWKVGLALVGANLMTWFFWIIFAQLVGAVLAMLAHRYGSSLAGVLVFTAGLVAFWFFASRLFYFSVFLGLGDLMNIYPVSWDGSGVPEYMSYVKYTPGYWPPLVSIPYTGYILPYLSRMLLGLVCLYIIASLTWRRTSMR